MSNTTILLVGHGSRHKAGNTEIETFAKNWRERNSAGNIELCFIEFDEVLLDDGLDNAAHLANKVVVVPLILNAAGHVKTEIPHHINQARKRHPDVEFIYARHLGANGKILTILKRNLRKTMATLHMPDPKITGTILLGRGSSDAQANGENAKMARWLYEVSQHELVDIAFTGISFPRLETIVQRQIRLGMTQITILPYYLFTGTLMERIKKQVDRLKTQNPQVGFALGDYFGFEDEIYQLLDERVAQALCGQPVDMTRIDNDFFAKRAELEHDHHPHHHPHHEETAT